MLNERRIRFEPFALDLANECLWKGSQTIKLRPKAFAVLAHLLSQAGELVTKERLIDAVWQDTFVGDAVLKVAIRQIREALSDDPKSPRFIESHRPGYRFIGRIDAIAPAAAVVRRARPRAPRPWRVARHSRRICRTRRALSRMNGWLESAWRNRQLVTGEAGIGKPRSSTRLRAVSAATGRADRQRAMPGTVRASEAYTSHRAEWLCREDIGWSACPPPMMAAAVPSLVTPSDRGRSAGKPSAGRGGGCSGDERTWTLTLKGPGASSTCTGRLFDAGPNFSLAHQRGRRASCAGPTARRVDCERAPLGAVNGNSVEQLCEELSLEYLSEAAVAEYLAVRFPENRFANEVAALIHDRTEGNPLFMVNTIDYLVAERLIEEREDGWQLPQFDKAKVVVPDSIRHLIEKQIDRLGSREQRILEAASVAGAEFSAPAVSAGLDEGIAEVELQCEELSRRHQFIRDCGVQTLPTGDVVGRYGFVHAVFRNVPQSPAESANLTNAASRPIRK